MDELKRWGWYGREPEPEPEPEPAEAEPGQNSDPSFEPTAELVPAELVPTSTELVPAELVPASAADQAEDLVGDWLGGMKETTRREYGKDIEQFARYLATRGIGTTPTGALDYLTGLSVGDAHRLVTGWKNAQLKAELSAATIGRRLAALKSFIKLGRRVGRVGWTLDVEPPPPEPKRDVKGPDPEAMKQIRTALRAAAGSGPLGKRDRAIVSLLYGLGLRRAEAAGLTLDDVDFEASTVRVLGKGRREKISLEMPAEVARDVGAWVLARGSEPGPLFHALGGPGARKPLDLGTVNRLVDRLGKAAGLSGKLRPHGFRHSAITALFRRKKTLAEVMAFSRHKDPKVLMRYHDELNNSAAEMARAVAKDL